jgi:hypothetical protein
MPPFFMSWKKKAINDSSLKSGGRILVFCCGTGLDFPAIGSVAIVYEPLELLERLVALVPPPGFHRVRFHGVLAPAAPERPQVVPRGTSNRGSPRPGLKSPILGRQRPS